MYHSVSGCHTNNKYRRNIRIHSMFGRIYIIYTHIYCMYAAIYSWLNAIYCVLIINKSARYYLD